MLAKDIIIKDNILDNFLSEGTEINSLSPKGIKVGQDVYNLSILRNEFKNIRSLDPAVKNGYGISFDSNQTNP